jgi:hypothetical protein
MLSEREQAIKNTLIDQVGGPASFVAPRKAQAYVDPEYLRIASRRIAVNKRRMIIFVVLYALVILTAVAVLTATAKDYNVFLWVAVGTFNAVNAAIHYSEYQKKKMAMAVFNILEEEDGVE